jgi:hypothetical protein
MFLFFCSSHQLFRSSPLSLLFCVPLPAPHTLATLAPRSPHAGHPCSAPAAPDWSRPALPQPNPAPQHASAAGPTCLSRALPDHARRPHLTPPSSVRQPPGPACLGRAPPGHAHRPPSLAPPRQAGRADVPTRPRVPSVGPTPPSSACRPLGPAPPCLGRTLPGSACRPPGLAPPDSAPPRPALPGPSRQRPVPASTCSSSESRAPLCIKFFS